MIVSHPNTDIRSAWSGIIPLGHGSRGGEGLANWKAGSALMGCCVCKLFCKKATSLKPFNSSLVLAPCLRRAAQINPVRIYW
jgi:hypothetical protein